MPLTHTTSATKAKHAYRRIGMGGPYYIFLNLKTRSFKRFKISEIVALFTFDCAYESMSKNYSALLQRKQNLHIR
jgi:hypothetical protein